MPFVRPMSIAVMLIMILLPAMALADPTEITNITQLNNIGTSGDYIITADIADDSSYTTKATFTGTLEAAIDPTTNMPFRISGLSAPLFATLTGTVKNLVLEDVAISGGADAGAIA
ncbi:MAG: hypothetical protein K6F85_02185, partial [Bacteroidales bacterium]|nr:hypothetical protein [Bacteroidales bacterium]